MQKSDTQILKGIAMLMMLIVHIWPQQLENWIVIDGVCLWNYLSNISEPVAFFLLLGGYGLACVSEKGDTHRYSRLIRLFIHYWVVLFLFALLAYMIKRPPVYPLLPEEIIRNFTAFHVSWNPVCQFLFPYVLLSLSYPMLFKMIDRFGAIIIGVLTFIIYGFAGMMYGKYGDMIFWEIPERYFFYMCPFMWGACLKKSKYLEKSKKRNWSNNGWFICAAFVTLFFFKITIQSPIITPIYVIFFVILFVKAPRLKNMDKVLKNIGNQSMNMWFIHGWICLILFKEQLYSLKYPLFVFLALLIISYILATAVDKIAKKIYYSVIILFPSK